MGEHPEIKGLTGESESPRELYFRQEYRYWEDFEYIEHFLPKNMYHIIF